MHCIICVCGAERGPMLSSPQSPCSIHGTVWSGLWLRCRTQRCKLYSQRGAWLGILEWPINQWLQLSHQQDGNISPPFSHLILCHPLLFLPSISPRIRVFSKGSVFHIRRPRYWSFYFSSVLAMNIQDWFPFNWLVWSPCYPRDFEESYPTLQFKHQFFGA